MKTKSKTFPVFLSLAAFAVLACAGVAQAQTMRRAEAEAARRLDTIQVASVNAKSPTVDLREVGRRVAPGVLEVSPDAVRGKRLILSSGGPNAVIVGGICIGKMNEEGCKGIYIHLGNSTK